MGSMVYRIILTVNVQVITVMLQVISYAVSFLNAIFWPEHFVDVSVYKYVFIQTYIVKYFRQRMSIMF